jgi:lactate dehydrogenase-like 2-hydroxyacid dehydrogenase
MLLSTQRNQEVLNPKQGWSWGKAEFKALPSSLNLICLTATGYNNIDVTKGKGIYNIGVCNVPDYSTDSVAQHTFSMLLCSKCSI